MVAELSEWSQYLSAPIDPQAVEDRRTQCDAAFRDQQDNLIKCYRTFKPKTIACMGAGCLTDIPVDVFLRGGSRVALIDWIPQITELGFQRDLVRRDGNKYACLVCEVETCPEQVCQGFAKSQSRRGGVCDNFRLSDNPSCCRCAGYKAGPSPLFLTAEVTQGRAGQFAQRMTAAALTCDTAAQCFQKAIDVCHDCAEIREELPLPTGSIDLVTSSMVVSQFEYEPYGFFSKLLARRYGADALLHDTALIPLMETLRTKLFELLMDAHLSEIYRVVNKDHGKVYFSVELFSSQPQLEKDQYFLVQGMPQVLEKLRTLFLFDFSVIPLQRAYRRTKMGAQSSIIQSYVLTPIPASL